MPTGGIFVSTARESGGRVDRRSRAVVNTSLLRLQCGDDWDWIHDCRSNENIRDKPEGIHHNVHL